MRSGNLALPLAERTLRAEQVAAVCFAPTMFRAATDDFRPDPTC